MQTTAPARDTHTTYRSATTPARRLIDMSATALAEPVHAPPTRHLVLLPHPSDPTPEQTLAKKAKRRLGRVTYSRTYAGPTSAGSFAPHAFNEAGFDVYGYDAHGNYDPTQRAIPDDRRPDDEGALHGAPSSRFIH